MFQENFYSAVQFMNTEEEKSWEEEMTTPTLEVNLVVELNSDVMKNFHSLQSEMKIFREDNINERKEQQAINKALLRNMTRGIPQGKPTQSTNRSKREPYHEKQNNPREAENEGTPEATKGDHHSPASDDSLSPRRKRQINDDTIHGYLKKIRALTYDGEVNTGEKTKEWLLGMSKCFQVHSYSIVMYDRLSIYNLNGKASRWWKDLKDTKKYEL